MARAVEHFALGALPLTHIYILCDGDAVSIERLDTQAAFVELVRRSYVVYFPQATRAAVTHLTQTARLAKHVPVARLERPRALAALSTLAALMEHDEHDVA